FWGSASEVSLPDGVRGLVATIDGIAYTVTEASIKSALQLDDLNAIDTMTNEEIFDGLWNIGHTKFLMYSRFLQIILDTDIEDTTPYPAPFTKKFFANMRHYLGPDMPLLAHMLNLGEPYFVQAQQQDVSPPLPSRVVASHPSPDPMPSPPGKSSPPPIAFGPAPTSGVVSTGPIPDIPSLFGPSEPVLETITSPFRDDDTGGGSFHESPPPLHEPSLSTTPSKPAHPEQSSEQEISPTTLDDVLILSQSKARARATTIIYKRLKKKKSSSGLDFTDADITTGGLDSAGGLVSAGGLPSAGISVAAGPTVPAEPSEEMDASIIWDDQDQWQIRSWRFYALPAIHVLETEAGDIIDSSGNDLTTAIQLIQSLLNQLNPAA
nr:hypothetical protein [Tanacetum cinerariifolium]